MNRWYRRSSNEKKMSKLWCTELCSHQKLKTAERTHARFICTISQEQMLWINCLKTENTTAAHHRFTVHTNIHREWWDRSLEKHEHADAIYEWQRSEGSIERVSVYKRSKHRRTLYHLHRTPTKQTFDYMCFVFVLGYCFLFLFFHFIFVVDINMYLYIRFCRAVTVAADAVFVVVDNNCYIFICMFRIHDNVRVCARAYWV